MSLNINNAVFYAFLCVCLAGSHSASADGMYA